MVVMSKLCFVAGLVASAHVAFAVEKCEDVEFNIAEAGQTVNLKKGKLCTDAKEVDGQVTVTVDLTMNQRRPDPVFYGFELPNDAYVAVKLDAQGEEDPATDSKLVAIGTKGLDRDACTRSNGEEIRPCVFTRRYPLQTNFPVGRCTRSKDYEALLEQGPEALENKNVCRLATSEKEYVDFDPVMVNDKLQFTLPPGVPLPSPLNVVYGTVVVKNRGDLVSANGDEFGNSLLMEIEVDGTQPPTLPPTLPPTETDAPTTEPPTTAPPSTEEPSVTVAPTAEETTEETGAPTPSTTTETPSETEAPTIEEVTEEPTVTVPPTIPPSVETSPPTEAPFKEETLSSRVMEDGVLTYTIKEDGVVDVSMRIDNQPSFSGFVGVGVSETGQMVGSKVFIGTMGGNADGVEAYELQGKQASSIVQISRRLLKQENCGTETVFVQDGDSVILEFCASQIGGEPLVDENGKLRKLVVAKGFDPALQSAHPASGRMTFDAESAEFIDERAPGAGGDNNDGEDGISGGAVAGIVIGILALVALAVAGVAHSKSKVEEKSEEPKDVEKQDIPAKSVPSSQSDEQQVHHQ